MPRALNCHELAELLRELKKLRAEVRKAERDVEDARLEDRGARARGQRGGHERRSIDQRPDELGGSGLPAVAVWLS